MLVFSQSLTVNGFVDNVFTHVVNPVIIILFYLALFWFVWHLALYLLNSEDAGKRKENLKHILYGSIGLFIIVSIQTIFLFLNRLAEVG